MQSSIYQYHNGQLGIVASVLYEDLKILSYDSYVKKSYRETLKKIREGKGANNPALLCWQSLPPEWKDVVVSVKGAPETNKSPLDDYFKIDPADKKFFDEFRFNDGSYLEPRHKKQYTINAAVLRAAEQLFKNRVSLIKRMGNSPRNVWETVAGDVRNFNKVLSQRGEQNHNLPGHERRLRNTLNNFVKIGLSTIISSKHKNQNAQKVNARMIALWNDIFAGQILKPSYIEVASAYESFLNGSVQVISEKTGEIYDPKHPDFVEVSDRSILNYLAEWESRVITHAKRSGDRQKFRQEYMPWHKLESPEYAGSMISVDDRQPPFEYAKGKRMWFYNGIDLASTAFTTWVYGESKEGIIIDFYRQLVRNYTEWGWNLPYELEGEMSLNSSFMNTFLEPGAMFQAVRIEANNARGKRIEGFYRTLRYNIEKVRLGWLARPFAKMESNQIGRVESPIIPKETIINNCLEDIQHWNNMLHPDQKKFPGKTRWQVCCEYQHPKLTPTNWRGILPHLGYKTATSCHAGIIKLQKSTWLIGDDSKLFTGENLLRVLNEIEGCPINVFWLDDNDGNVLKALVYNTEGRLICEAIPHPKYQRSVLERTEQHELNRSLMSQYVMTVESYIKKGLKTIDKVCLIPAEKSKPGDFKIRGLQQSSTIIEERETEVVEAIEDEFEHHLNTIETTFKTSTKARF